MALQCFTSLLILTGPNGIYISVAQYGDTNKVEFTWRDEQTKSQLLSLVERIPRRTSTVPALGSGQ